MALSAGCYAAGYLTGLAAFAWMARRRGLATEGIFALLVAGIVGGLVCANLAQWLTTGAAGKTVLGGITGGYVAVALAKKALGIRRPTGDLFAVAICAGEAVGRWGCFFGGCCYGKPTGAAWAVWQHDAFRHPTQLYLSLSCLLILIVLIWLEVRRDKTLPENALFCIQGALYCIARFGIEFWRAHPGSMSLITSAQWACAAGLMFFFVRLRQLLKEKTP